MPRDATTACATVKEVAPGGAPGTGGAGCGLRERVTRRRGVKKRGTDTSVSLLAVLGTARMTGRSRHPWTLMSEAVGAGAETGVKLAAVADDGRLRIRCRGHRLRSALHHDVGVNVASICAALGA